MILVIGCESFWTAGISHLDFIINNVYWSFRSFVVVWQKPFHRKCLQRKVYFFAVCRQTFDTFCCFVVIFPPCVPRLCPPYILVMILRLHKSKTFVTFLVLVWHMKKKTVNNNNCVMCFVREIWGWWKKNPIGSLLLKSVTRIFVFRITFVKLLNVWYFFVAIQQLRVNRVAYQGICFF